MDEQNPSPLVFTKNDVIILLSCCGVDFARKLVNRLAACGAYLLPFMVFHISGSASAEQVDRLSFLHSQVNTQGLLWCAAL